MNGNHHFTELLKAHPELEVCMPDIKAACNAVVACYQGGGKLLICGNGGSSADADHIVGEMMKRFEIRRPIARKLAAKLIGISPERGTILASGLEKGLPAISLTAHTALVSAITNDTGGDFVFAQQLMGYGKEGDVLIALSSSGNSQNVVDAVITARALDLRIIGLTGMTGGKMKQFCDILICIPAAGTCKIQEYHLPVYHTICKVVEQTIFGKK
jgi:D-sedoheptulose 7-phosphate isomerase